MQSLFLSRTSHCLRRTALYNARYLATKPLTSPGASQSSNSADATKPPDSPAPTPESAESTPPSTTSLSLDFSPKAESEGEPMQRTGARSSKDSLSSIERRRRFLGRATLAAFGVGVIAGTFYLGREWEADELKAKKLRVEDAPSTRFGRTKERITSMFDFFSKPTWDELLPPAVPPLQKPYTLLLSIDDLLVTSTWDRKNGWRTAKRPGVDYFLAYLSQFYEVVIFTTQNHYTAIPIIEKLDPYSFFITYKLFRESTRSVNGSVVKDLSYLNRDLSKVIIMDTDPEHVALQPENAIVLPKWKGDPSDKDLVAMIPFLESIAIYKPQDIRPILKAYQGKNIPIEYAKKEAEAKRQFLEDWKKSGKGKVASGGGFTLSHLFGGSSVSPDSHSPEPLTYLEQKRKEAQAHYREEQAYIAANKAQFDKLIEDDRQAAAAAMSGNLWTVLSGVGSPSPSPQDQQQQGNAKDAGTPPAKSS
ncbi:HAD-like protein [Fomitiporia mediterranea MF3/22]|uniref:HAD-like protein n=1 Tax=Fomitiporia mediterranea (strain MF3/22) TaxID=694068 RepID=UPI0004407961|nr:HAD-like protein [Fomitiporia mediterranea MF3/22]EJD08232.1 HAD-like protein [Fomitiporia mediterranea MF3/22]